MYLMRVGLRQTAAVIRPVEAEQAQPDSMYCTWHQFVWDHHRGGSYVTGCLTSRIIRSVGGQLLEGRRAVQRKSK